MKNLNTITGTLSHVSEIIRGQGWTRIDFHLDASTYNQTTGEKYENILPLSVWKERCALLDPVAPGQPITVSYFLKGGRNKEGDLAFLKAFVVNIEPTTAETQPVRTVPVNTTEAVYGKPVTAAVAGNEPIDDLPF